MSNEIVNEPIQASDQEMDGSKPKSRLERGRLYQYNGKELVPVEPSDVAKVPVTAEAFDALKGVRKQVAEITKGRPELMIVASAMLIAASKVPDIDVFAKEYGHDFYS